jgi:hypothetical protein
MEKKTEAGPGAGQKREPADPRECSREQGQVQDRTSLQDEEHPPFHYSVEQVHWSRVIVAIERDKYTVVWCNNLVSARKFHIQNKY